MNFNAREFSETIWDFVEKRQKEKHPIDVLDVKAFYEEYVNEPTGDITEKELFGLYFEPLRWLRWRRGMLFCAQKFHSYAMSRYIENDFDYVAVVAGTEGKGKSSFVLDSADDLAKLGIGWNMNDLLFRGSSAEDALNAISATNHGQVIFDEAKPFFDKRQSMNSEQVELLQEITAQRKNNNIIWLCIGDVDEIDKYFRERRARSVIMIPDRKLFVVLLNMGVVGMGRDRFRLDYLQDVILMQNKLDYTAQISELTNLASAHTIGQFPKYNAERFAEYVKLKNEKNSAVRAIQKFKSLKRRKKYEKELGIAGVSRIFGSDSPMSSQSQLNSEE
jgi:hypothetical protein